METNSTLEEMAMQYAMTAPTDYESGKMAGDWKEAEQKRIKHEMFVRFGAFISQEAIKVAEQTLKLVDFHSISATPPSGD